MGQVLHGSARTTEAVRRVIQDSQESPRALSKRYGINQKTVAKWSEADKQTWMDPCLPAERGRRWRTCRQGRRNRTRRCCLRMKRRSSSRSVDTLCWLWMIACTHFSRRFRTCHDHLSIGACNVMASVSTRPGAKSAASRRDMAKIAHFGVAGP